MNYSEWLDSLTDPLYEANGDKVCPPGYRYDKKTLRCVPRTKKDDVSADSGKKNSEPINMPSFGVIGHTGLNGDGYALGEVERDS